MRLKVWLGGSQRFYGGAITKQPELENLIQPPSGRPLKESRSVDYKETLDISSTQDVVEIAKDVAAFANSGGGRIVLGIDKSYRHVGLTDDVAARLTPEDFDNKIRSYLDPPVHCDVVRVLIDGRKYVILDVDPSPEPFCTIKKDGAYKDHKGRQTTAYRVGDVFIRRGAKSERASRTDLMRIFNKGLDTIRKAWLRDVRLITNAPIGSELSMRSSARSVRRTNDPNAPAVPGLMDTEKFGTLNEELTGAVKLWKTDPNHRISEPRLMKMYAERDSLHLDTEGARLLLESALTHRAPSCYWASKLDRRVLKRILRRAIQSNTQIGREALSLVALLGGKWGGEHLRSASSSHLISVRNRAAQLQAIIGLRLAARIQWFVHQSPLIISYRLDGTMLSANLGSLVQTKGSAGEVATALASDLEARDAPVGAKQALKRLDVALYGADL